MRLRIAVVVLVAALAPGARADQAVQNVQQALKDQGFYYGEVTVEKGADKFAGIPHKEAPPHVLRHVILSAHNLLARQGLNSGAINIYPSPDLEFAVRTYQARVRLRMRGRLALDPRAAIDLVPGANAP